MDRHTNQLGGITYIQHFYNYLFRCYLGWNGKAGALPLDFDVDDFEFDHGWEGAKRWQCCTTRALTLEAVFDSLRRFKEIVLRINAKFQAGGTMSFDKYAKILKSVIASMEGIGQLTGQKLLHCACMLRVIEDQQLLKYWLPGSSVHTSQPKGEFEFESSKQTKQLVRVLMYHQQFKASKAEEVLLKP